MKKIIIYIGLLNLLFLSLPQFSRADSVHLRNGDIITGTVVSYAGGLCVLNTKYGATISLETKEIVNIYTDKIYEVVFVSGENVKGQLVQGKDSKTILKSDNFGELSVQADKIQTMKVVFEPSPEIAKKKNTGKNEASGSNEQQNYGQDVDREPPLDFLTGSTVLLAPGSFEMELGLSYKQNRSSYKLTQVGYFERSSYSARQLELALNSRAGLWNGGEGWVCLPFTYGQVKDVSTNEWVRSSTSFDVGDLSFGLQQTLHRESENIPALTASLAVNAPTGQRSYRDVVNTWKDSLDNGSGHWAITPSISFARTTDPAILFGGVAYQYSFERRINGYNIKPGWGLIGYMGLGFALNEKLSLGTRVSRAYYSELTADGTKVEGSDFEPMDLSFSASYRAWDNWVVTPQVVFGLNDDAGSPTLGIRFTRRF